MFGLGLVNYYATGEGNTFMAATGQETEVKEFFGDFFSIGMVFKSVEEWLRLEKIDRSELSEEELYSLELFQYFKKSCSQAWEACI